MAEHGYLSEQGDLEGTIEYLPIQEWFIEAMQPGFHPETDSVSSGVSPPVNDPALY